jgi:hypothetical protein
MGSTMEHLWQLAQIWRWERPAPQGCSRVQAVVPNERYSGASNSHVVGREKTAARVSDLHS